MMLETVAMSSLILRVSLRSFSVSSRIFSRESRRRRALAFWRFACLRAFLISLYVSLVSFMSVTSVRWWMGLKRIEESGAFTVSPICLPHDRPFIPAPGFQAYAQSVVVGQFARWGSRTSFQATCLASPIVGSLP